MSKSIIIKHQSGGTDIFTNRMADDETRVIIDDIQLLHYEPSNLAAPGNLTIKLRSGDSLFLSFEGNREGLAALKELEEAVSKLMTKEDMSENMDFGTAIKNLKTGNKMARSGWNGKGMYVSLQTPDENSKMTLPYIYMKTVCNNLVPWLASQTDVLANDWQLAE